MRNAFLAAVLLAASPVAAQQAPLSSGLNSGIGSGFEASVSSGFNTGIESGLGADTRRTMADGYFRGDRNAGALNGGGCAPTQIDPDHTGCRPVEALRGAGSNPDRIITYYGNSAFGQSNQTYSGDSAIRLQGGSPDPNRPF